MVYLILYLFVLDYPGFQWFSAETKKDAEASISWIPASSGRL